MAEEQAQNKQEKKLPIKTIAVMFGVFALEALAFSLVIMFSGDPAEVEGSQGTEEQMLAASMEETVEELIIADKFQNTKQGRSYLYDTEVYIEVRRKHQDMVLESLEAKRNAIRMDIATVIRQADPAQLTEPTLATITRQIKAKLDEHFGKDEDGEPRVQRVLIPTCTQIKTDL